MAWWTAAAGAASGIGGSLISYFGQKAENKKNRKFAVDMYNREVADKERQWHLTNDYNRPINEMARMREAGLNPMLMYGGAGSGGNAGGMPSPSSFGNHDQKAPEWKGNGIGDYIGFIEQGARTDNTRANTLLAESARKKTDAEALKTAAETLNLGNVNKLQQIELQKPIVETAKAQLDAIRQGMEYVPKNYEVSKQNADANTKNASTNSRNADINSRNADINSRNAETNRINAETGRFNAVTGRITAMSNELRNQVLNEFTGEDVERVKQVIEGHRFDNFYKELRNDLEARGISSNSPYYLKIVAAVARMMKDGKSDEEIKKYWQPRIKN